MENNFDKMNTLKSIFKNSKNAEKMPKFCLDSNFLQLSIAEKVRKTEKKRGK